ncbi:MAG: SGNH/GDSL hydrolase family protein [Lachnospiraceae bacterium]|nr:SGNH/GDSL hydrolase family protein [Lachnospiraceae bacterium]
MLKETLIKEIPEMKIHGRTTKCLEPLTLFWTASGFECNVTGSEFWVELEVTYDNYEPWFSYTINGDWVGRQMLQKGRYWVPLFRGMSPENVKNVHFYKDLQAMSDDGNSYIHIHAFRHDGLFHSVADKELKIEFIGDSITSGEGLIGAKQETDWIPMFFSAVKSYAYQTAHILDAEYRIYSQSGWGVYNTWDNNTKGALPKYYKEICGVMSGSENERLGGNQQHDFADWQPDFVIVNLGTNDAASFDQPEWVDEKTGERHKMRRNPDGSCNMEDVRAFQQAVKDFLGLVRECNPKARIVWCYGMLGIDFQMYICEAVAEYAGETGDHKVSYLQLPDTTKESVGSREHPGYLCHRQAAKVLSDYIRKFL